MENILIAIIIFSSVILMFGLYCLVYSTMRIKSAAERKSLDDKNNG